MKPQKFREGDRVRRRKSFYVGLIVEAKYRPAVAAIALVRGREIEEQIMQERWFFKVEGDGFHPRQWIADEALESSQPCPNCHSIGWDWVVGCERCGLSPDDAG